MAMALENIKILDFTIMMQGPHATQMLADMGAEVIKVERPGLPAGRVDERYGRNGRYGKDPEDTTFTPAVFLSHNRNKKSVTVNLKHETGREIIRRLVQESDIVYQNFRPGVMSRLGFGYEDCRKINPSVIYASASGWGEDGPYVDRPGQDMLAQGLGGAAAVNVSAEGRPTAIGFSMSDLLGAMYGVYGVLCALYHREQTGEGQEVKISLLDATVAGLSEMAVHFLNTGIEPVRGTPMHANPYIAPPYGAYATKDGYIALSGGHKVAGLCRALGIDNLEEDPRFDTVQKRDRNRAEFEQLLEEALGRKTTEEWLPLMAKEDLWAAPVKSLPEVFTDPQVLHNNMVVSVDSPIGPLRLPGIAAKLSKTPGQVRTAPPTLGQHTEEVLESLGYTREEIEQARRDEAI